MVNPTVTAYAEAALFTSPDVVLLACAYLMYRRHQGRNFPFFLLYVAAVATNDAIRVVVNYWSGAFTHFYIYYTTDAINIGFSFLVLYEVLDNVLTSGTVKVSRSTFFMIIAVLFLAAATLAFFTNAPTKEHPILNAILLAQGMVRFAQIGVLAMFVILTIFFGFYWGNQAFGIAMGFGFYASSMLVNLYFRRRLGNTDATRFGLTDVAAYSIASVIWLIYVLRNQAMPDDVMVASDRISGFEKPLAKIVERT